MKFPFIRPQGNEDPEKGRGSMKPTRLGWLIAVAVVVIGTLVRIHLPFAKSSLDWERPEGMIRSDPGLVYYITERIIDGGGLPPDDFRADPRIEHPDVSDLPAMFTVGQEFLVAWSWLLFGGDRPLHAWCVIVMALIVSLTALGIYGATLEMTGKVWLAGLAAALYGLSPANYRTLGFILIREDLSLPLFVLHLWLVARAARVRTWSAFLLSGLALAAALATWHAMSFVVTVEAACVFLWFLRTSRSPFTVRGAWALPAVVAVVSLVIPVLQSKLFLFSLPMQMAGALLIAAAVECRKDLGPGWRTAVGLASFATLFALSLGATWLVTGGISDYAHVFDLMWSKIRFLGRLPDDPNRLSFGARLIWQGPFDTGSFLHSFQRMPIASLLLAGAVAMGVLSWLRGKRDALFSVGILFATAAWLLGVLVVRLLVVAGIAAPIAAALFFTRLKMGKLLFPALLLLGIQAFLFVDFAKNWSSIWHEPVYRLEMSELVNWMRENLRDNGAVACDFVTATEILVHTGHPVVLQPKYETHRSRDRIQEFIHVLYHGSPEEFRRLLVDKYDCRYLLVYRRQLWSWRYKGGLFQSAKNPPEGSAAEGLIKRPPDEFAKVPGYKLLYRSPFQTDWMRLYLIE